MEMCELDLVVYLDRRMVCSCPVVVSSVDFAAGERGGWCIYAWTFRVFRVVVGGVLEVVDSWG